MGQQQHFSKGRQIRHAKRFKDKSQDGKVPLYIPELKATVYVYPNANVTEVRNKYLAQREQTRHEIAHNDSMAQLRNR